MNCQTLACFLKIKLMGWQLNIKLMRCINRQLQSEFHIKNKAQLL